MNERQDSGVFRSDTDAGEEGHDHLRHDGEEAFVADFCRICRRYKRDALSGPNRTFFRRVERFCSCEDNKVTIEIKATDVANWT